MIANYTNHAANERTFLAWIRTGLAVAAFGFFLVKLNVFVDAVDSGNLSRLPEPSAFVAVAMKVMPVGLLGLLMCAMFGATLTSMDAAVNKYVGVFVRSFYRPILKPAASEQHLLVTGSDLNFVKVNHWLFVGSFSSVLGSRPAIHRSKLFAKSSLAMRSFKTIRLHDKFLCHSSSVRPFS